jgi:hypothetical protein
MLLLLALAGVLVAGYFVYLALKPLVQSGVVTDADWRRMEDESSELLSRRDRLVEELRDLEFEAAMHKLSDGDLAELRARYEAEAVDVVRKLDEGAEQYQRRLAQAVEKAPAKVPAAPVAEAPAATEVPAAGVPADAPAPASATCRSCETALPADAAFCDACGSAQGAASCEACGASNRAGARFCKACGGNLVRESA